MRLILLFFLLFSPLTFAACRTSIEAYDTQAGRYLSRYPDITRLSKLIAKDLLEQPALPAHIREYLAQGGDPLVLGIPGVLDGLHETLLELIDRSGQLGFAKRKMKQTLALAVENLKRNPPPIHDLLNAGFSGGGSDGSVIETEFGDYSMDPEKRIEQIIKTDARNRCLVRNFILVASTIVMNLGSSLQDKWEEYSGEEKLALRRWWGGLVTGETWKGLLKERTWKKSFSDEKFRHNNFLNLLQMSLLGSFTCVTDMKLGVALNGLSSAVLSTVSQYLTNDDHNIDPAVLALDTLFVMIISNNKTKLVMWISERMRASHTPMARVLVYETLMELISEGVGGTLYTKALNGEEAFFKWLGRQHEKLATPANP